jgi:hypothetical protein
VSEAVTNYKHEDIQAIVIAGETSPSENIQLSVIVLKVVETKEVKLTADIGADEVVARGAAVVARNFQISPVYMAKNKDLPC